MSTGQSTEVTAAAAAAALAAEAPTNATCGCSVVNDRLSEPSSTESRFLTRAGLGVKQFTGDKRIRVRYRVGFRKTCSGKVLEQHVHTASCSSCPETKKCIFEWLDRGW